MYMVKWFKNEDEAKQFQEKHGGILYKNVPRSRTRRAHIAASEIMGFDPDKFRYSVSLKMPKGEFEI